MRYLGEMTVHVSILRRSRHSKRQRIMTNDMRKITLLIDRDLDEELTEFAIATGQNRDSIARAAIAGWLEDQEDIRDAQRIIAQNNPQIPLAEVKRILELDN
jgi:hypothetical protein